MLGECTRRTAQRSKWQVRAARYDRHHVAFRRRRLLPLTGSARNLDRADFRRGDGLGQWKRNRRCPQLCGRRNGSRLSLNRERNSCLLRLLPRQRHFALYAFHNARRNRRGSCFCNCSEGGIGRHQPVNTSCQRGHAAGRDGCVQEQSQTEIHDRATVQTQPRPLGPGHGCSPLDVVVSSCRP